MHIAIRSELPLSGEVDVLLDAEVFVYVAAGILACCSVGVMCRLSVKRPPLFDDNGSPTYSCLEEGKEVLYLRDTMFGENSRIVTLRRRK